MIVKAVKLTSDSFAKFGKVVDIPKAPPLVDNEAATYWGTIATFKIEGESEVGLAIVKKGSTQVEFMERHLDTPELIAPIEGDFVLPVAVSKNLKDPKEIPNPEDIKAFYVSEKQAYIMEKGVWHGGPFPIGETASFFVVFKKETSKHDVDLKKMIGEKKVTVTW